MKDKIYDVPDSELKYWQNVLKSGKAVEVKEEKKKAETKEEKKEVSTKSKK